MYSRLPNKRGGVRIIGGFEMVRHNNRWGWNNRGGEGAWKNRKQSFSLVNTYLLYIYVNCDVTYTFTFEFWLC